MPTVMEISSQDSTGIAFLIGGLFLLLCAYSGQYWARRLCREMEKVNAKLDGLLAAQNPKKPSP